MLIFKRFIKLVYTIIFTIDKKTINNCNVSNSKKEHIKSRLYIFLLLIPFCYIIFFGYISESFNLFNIFRTLLFILLFRLIAKDFTDTIIVMFFYKSSYKYTLRDIRKRKIRKLNKLKYRIFK